MRIDKRYLLFALFTIFMLWLMPLKMTRADITLIANNHESEIEAVSGELNAGEITLRVGASFKLKLTGASVDHYQTNLKSVATVSSAGKITGKKAGQCNVVCYDTNGNLHVCRVTVIPVSINREHTSMYVGTSQMLTLEGAKASKWYSSDSSIVSVDKKGKVTAKKAGSAEIICEDKKGNKYRSVVDVYKKNGTVLTAEQSKAAIEKKLGGYEINKIYQEGDKVFCYYATNGAFGDSPSSDELREVLNRKYPGCFTSSNMNTVIQFCDGVEVFNWCSYSICYEECFVSGKSDYSYFIVDHDKGDTTINYMPEEEQKPVYQISKANFGELRPLLLLYDLDGDGWLSEAETYWIQNLSVDYALSDIKGIDKLNNLFSLYLTKYTGTELVLENTPQYMSVLDLSLDSKKLSLVAPTLKNIYVSNCWTKKDDGMHPAKIDFVDVSKCTGAEYMSIAVAGGLERSEIKLPEASTALSRLQLGGCKAKELNLNGLTNLESINFSYCDSLEKLIVDKCKKLKTISGGTTPKLKLSGVKLAKGAKIDFTVR